VAPSEATIRRTLQSSDSEAIEAILNGWIKRLSLEKAEETDEAIAVDGKVLKGARNKENSQTHLLSAVLHEQGLTVGQVKIDSKSNEIPSVPTLLEPLEITDRIVTFDALHTQKKRPNTWLKRKKHITFSP
jgi:hypothetical protein